MSSRNSGHESYQLALGPIVLSAVALTVVVALAFFGMAGLRERFDGTVARDEAPAHALSSERELPPAPRLQAQPAAEVEAHRRSIAERAQAYEWIDVEAGVVRIPLERALDVAVERGLPHFEASAEAER